MHLEKMPEGYYKMVFDNEDESTYLIMQEFRNKYLNQKSRTNIGG